MATIAEIGAESIPSTIRPGKGYHRLLPAFGKQVKQIICPKSSNPHESDKSPIKLNFIIINRASEG